MGDKKGFMRLKRAGSKYRSVSERVKDHAQVFILREETLSREQASRCMDCGTPFCNWGCPLGNYIPEWNDLMFGENWEDAFNLLDATNDLPEITGRVCPAPCEFSCVLGINDDPITIRENELAVIERAFKAGIIKPKPPLARSGKTVAVIGSGPAGLSCAAQLNRAGHKVTVFERDDKIGGIMRYGIPDFKLEKKIIDRRIEIWKKEGIEFKAGVNVGVDFKASKLKKDFDAVVLACGSRVPRDIKIEGRGLKGIHFAMDYLVQSNRRAAGIKIEGSHLMDAKGRKVVVIGGGDTGADCIGTANRQGAVSVIQIEVLPKPPVCRTDICRWPKYPTLLKTTTSHEEGCERQWAVLTKKFVGENGKVKQLSCVRVDLAEKDVKGNPVMKEIPGTEFSIDADLVIIAVGFLHPEHDGIMKDLAVEFDKRGNVKTGDNYMTTVKGVFSAGDARRGQSLIVWAISEGRNAARHIDAFLTGK